MCAVRKPNHTLKSITNIAGKLEDKNQHGRESLKWLGFGTRSGNKVSGILSKKFIHGKGVMEKYRMHGFVRTPFCRVIAQILVFLMVMQGLPLWELSQSYEWVPDKFCRVINHVVAFLSPGQAEAATVVFGPKQYHRTEGKPNVYTDSFAGVPAEGNLAEWRSESGVKP